MTNHRNPVNQAIFRELMDERDRQDAKWGPQAHDDAGWFPIFMEEVLEVVKAMSDGDGDGLYTELVQTLAVGFHWLETIHGRR